MGCCVAVPQDSVAIIERFGKFDSIAEPGCKFLIFVRVETKSKDNVFVRLVIAVNFKTLDDNASRYNAFYKLSNASHQITAYVEDVVRASVPTVDLDDLFMEKQHIAESIYAALTEQMRDFGYEIVAVLVTDIEPDPKVKFEMNEINVNRRMRVANQENAEAAKLVQIKAAEAQADAARLSGEGVARQRKAIIDGVKNTVDTLATDVGLNKKDVMNLMLVTQYFDTLRDVARGRKEKHSKVIFSPRSRRPPAVSTAR